MININVILLECICPIDLYIKLKYSLELNIDANSLNNSNNDTISQLYKKLES